MGFCSNLCLKDYYGLYSGFGLIVATQYAYDSNILKMLHVIFYAIVLNNVAELGLASRVSIYCMMWVTQKLDWAPIASWLGDIDYRLRRAKLLGLQTHLRIPRRRAAPWKTWD